MLQDGMMAKSRKRLRGLPSDVVAPTPERSQHDPIERDDRQIVDASGGIGRPFRVIDTLAIMLRRETITAAMARAGYQFRDDFAVGALDPLRCGSMVRTSGGDGRDAPAVSQQAGRDRVHAALNVLGGRTTPSGACCWHVLGEGKSLREWAMREGWCGRSLRIHAASGILIGALGILAVHYGLDVVRPHKY